MHISLFLNYMQLEEKIIYRECNQTSNNPDLETFSKVWPAEINLVCRRWIDSFLDMAYLKITTSNLAIYKTMIYVMSYETNQTYNLDAMAFCMSYENAKC